MSFDDKTKTPDEKSLARGLGASKAPWDEIVAHISAAYPPTPRPGASTSPGPSG